MTTRHQGRTRDSRAAIQRLYIAMRHLFIRGSYKPMGVSGEAMKEALMTLSPEIYGSINDTEQVELSGLLYIFERLPRGIEECQFIRLISREGYEHSDFEPIVPVKRRRNCYRIDYNQMLIEVTRGRSDIYDVLTHLTFMYIEAEKIRRNSLDSRNRIRREWQQLEEIVAKKEVDGDINDELALSYLSTLLGRSYEETLNASKLFDANPHMSSLFNIAYGLGKLSICEHLDKEDREIVFSKLLRDKVGHHIYGELWASRIKEFLWKNKLQDRPLHIISANLHSVANILYAKAALGEKASDQGINLLAEQLSTHPEWNKRVQNYAKNHGMYTLEDTSGTNLSVQVFDTSHINLKLLPDELPVNIEHVNSNKPVIIVMDYAFGEQAFETMDELLKPFQKDDEEEVTIDVVSISIMGKAGILTGNKGDLMIPTAYVFEGTADNYPLQNDLKPGDFHGCGLGVYQGSMITVLGTSLQNKEVLDFFKTSSWNAIGLEMEGAHYQKAIQAASQIRHSIRRDVVLRYAYYASDNPLISGHTLASGSLGTEGVKPTYLITLKILEKVLG